MHQSGLRAQKQKSQNKNNSGYRLGKKGIFVLELDEL